MKHHYGGCQGGPDCDCDEQEESWAENPIHDEIRDAGLDCAAGVPLEVDKSIHFGPHITRDDEWKREWVHLHPPRFYLYKSESGDDAGKWCVIDRDFDLMVGKSYARKADCVKAFIKLHSSQS